MNPSRPLPNRRGGELWVCWTPPRQAPPGEALLLSFLAPSEEEVWRSRLGGRLRSARELSGAVRGQARQLYLDLVVRIGLIPCADGRTFRQCLARPGQASRWWYHPVAFRGCETDPTFDWIIAIQTIRFLADSTGTRRLRLVGAPSPLAAVLGSTYDVEEQSRRAREVGWRLWLRGIGSRVRFMIRAWRQIGAARRDVPAPDRACDVALSGFWDWSARWDASQQQLSDRYFKRLPTVLGSQTDGQVAWFLWMDPLTAPGRHPRRLSEVLRPLRGRPEAVLLQGGLSRWDVVKAVIDLTPLRSFLALRRQPAYAAAFQDGEVNYAPLFSARLLRGFLDASLPQRELVALAVSRACRRYQPAVSIHFLEHFPFSRAWYEGVRQAGSRTICCAVQHASYSHEKTFVWLDPEREWRGAPDGCAVPHPDVVCAMGTLGRNIFLECGYPSQRVPVTGSPRYDHVSLDGAVSGPRQGAGVTVLLALGLAPELDMVDAACAAARGLDGVRLVVRNHPFSHMDRQPGFAPYRSHVTLSQGSLTEDLQQADVVLFTYSTVAEEALLLGKPVWQWMPLGFNGSALTEAASIPRLATVEALRRALVALRDDPFRFVPSASVRQAVLEQLFYRGDGRAAERVADVVQALRRHAAPDTSQAVPA